VTSPVFCGIATHDEAIVNELCRFVREQGVAKNAFEFQMLYGVRRDLQRRLAAEGFGVRVYIPFGTEWYPYFMRRLAERPANVLFLAKNFFKKLGWWSWVKTTADPCGMTNKRTGNCKGGMRGPSTSLRSGRDDGVEGV